MADPSVPAQQSAGVYEYTDEAPHTYCFHDGTVITPQRGDVCAIPYDPGDGRWQKSKAKPTRLPDNHPQQIAAMQATAAQARAEANNPTLQDAPSDGAPTAPAADPGKATP